MKYFVQIFEKGEWKETLWTNKVLDEDREKGSKLIPGSYADAVKALKIAETTWPDCLYRIIAVPRKTIGNILQERYDEISKRAQEYSLTRNRETFVGAVLTAEANGALEMLNAFKEAEKEHEENSDTIDLSALVRFLCTGEVGQAQALVEKFNTLFPSLVSVTKRAADAERDHRPATLGSSARRI